MQVEVLIEKIKSLPPEGIAEVEDFVDSIANRDTAAARHASIAAYAAEHGGSDVDLDTELEKAAIEYLSDEEA